MDAQLISQLLFLYGMQTINILSYPSTRRQIEQGALSIILSTTNMEELMALPWSQERAIVTNVREIVPLVTIRRHKE